ncbi:matrix metalloproteinase-28 [Callorhinchus milii]|uniref:Matrix metallopeptidase 28 n=1 Tax=Callorhinchus milii TaxID=7868 RepID=A0A4W3JD59_CALMI|nr:matrix metalloproteinase-28 [Callorhinchus milii]|eukprot:gi/632957946/ref/XP_007894760.1/ PREDICTED: matrix metalloproteinase-28 [Callorhinchus milii]
MSCGVSGQSLGTWSKLLIVSLLFTTPSGCLPVGQTQPTDTDKDLGLPAAEAFLEKYGYLEPGSHRGLNSAEVREAVREFQWISHLPVSGALDENTVRRMAEPRCGVKDTGSRGIWGEHVKAVLFGQSNKPKRIKRYSPQGEKWYRHHLTYKIINWPRYLEPGRVRAAVKTAFELWSNVSSLSFGEAPAGAPADIRLAFYQGEHNDGIGNAFDGPGGALAHAFFPRRGEAHFDNDERWSLYRGKGRNLFIVTAHEIGHTLGLEHSPVRNALMSPFYKKLGRDFLLSWDDMMAIQKLYGKPFRASAVQLPMELLPSFQELEEHSHPGVPSGTPSYCRTQFDTLTMDLNENIYIFRGGDYWVVSKVGSVRGPLSLREGWPGLPTTIEAAAVSEREGKFYFFRGGRCWRYRGAELEEGFPVRVSAMGLPRHPDAAFYFQPLGHLVVFKRSRYYVLNEETLRVEQYYPRPLRDWKGIPVGINGVFTWSERWTYFIKDDAFWKFDNSRLRALGSGRWAEELAWAGCNNNNNSSSTASADAQLT